MRLLIAILAGALLFLVFKALLSGPQPSAARRRQNKGQANNEKMVPCELCELHLPLSEAVKQNERFFCSEKHAHEWQTSRDK